MKARKLKKILNNTKYTVTHNEKYITIGSSFCHDLISVNKDTLEVKYALDSRYEGRSSLKHKKLLFIWDKLHELIKSGEMKDIIEGQDCIKNPLPVHFVKDGKIIETYTDKYGYPNTTIDGYAMHNGEYFETKKEAIKGEIENYTYWIKNGESRVMQLEKELNEAMDLVEKDKNYVLNFKLLNNKKQ